MRSLIKNPQQHFLLRYQEGRCLNQPVGKNSFAAIPTRIAKFLGLPHAEMYTGHSFSSTSATLLADTEACSNS